MIAIGGSNLSGQFLKVASDEQALEAFTESVLKFLTQYNFDGVSIDWYNFDYSMIPHFVRLLRRFAKKFAGTSLQIGITVIDPAISSMRYINFEEFIE